MFVLELDNVSKSFSRGFWGRRHQVLDGLSLRLEAGEVFGLLGQNGAGKTTTMRLVLGLSTPDSGCIRLFGRQDTGKASRARVGYLGDEVGLYPYLNADEMIQLVGELYRVEPGRLRSRKKELLQAAGLEDRPRLKIKKYSKGMKQRLGVALAVLSDPEFLILDEPYGGLDPIGRRQLRQLLQSLKKEGKTILLSSHIVPDVEAVCDRVGVLANGRIQTCLSLQDIYSQKTTLVEITASGVDHRTFDPMHPGVQVVYSDQRAVVLKCDGKSLQKSVISKVYAVGGEVLEVKPLRFNLEDYLLEALEPTSPERTEALSAEIEEMSYAHDE